MSISMYAISVPAYQQMLTSLDVVLGARSGICRGIRPRRR